MCGIVGFLNKNNQDENSKIIKKMNDAIFHRGPDDEGFFVDQKVALGMRRLSIIDIDKGHQPIWNKDKTKCIFFNGEIYNYKELRKNLLTEYSFETESDTETILALYEKYKEETPSMLRGMFVFCIYDTQNNELFIARDHFGIKPFYYFKTEDKIMSFGSEIKSILLDPRYNKTINSDAIYYYLQYQYNPLDETFFKDIYKLNPGYFIRINTNNYEFEIQKYFEYKFKPNQDLKLEDAKNEIRDLLNDSVEHHAISDVPVGAFLSGGVDSSINATLLSKHLDKKIETFTIGSEQINEFTSARLTSDKIQSNHNEKTVTKEEYFNALKKVVFHFDEPVADPSAILLYLLSKEASKKVKVVLSGEGADEFFGGYKIYYEYYDRKKLDVIPKFIRENILRHLAFSKLRFYGKNYLIRYFIPLNNRYIGNANLYKKSEMDVIWVGKKEKNDFNLNDTYKKASTYTEPTQMQYVDINTWLVNDILAKADKMSMANSLELRVPFLDIEVAKYASQLTDELKFNNRQTKYALREAFKGIVPSKTYKKAKLGFPTELGYWINEDLDLIFRTLKESKHIIQYIKIEELDRLQGQKDKEYRKIFALYMLELWHNVFID